MHAWCFTHPPVVDRGQQRATASSSNGWDGFLSDNWLSGNGGVRLRTRRALLRHNDRQPHRVEQGRRHPPPGREPPTTSPATTSTAAARPASRILASRSGAPPSQITVTGNIIYRSGETRRARLARLVADLIDGAEGVTVVGNAMMAGQDDSRKGDWTPSTASSTENVKPHHQGQHPPQRRLEGADRATRRPRRGVIVKDKPGN